MRTSPRLDETHQEHAPAPITAADLNGATPGDGAPTDDNGWSDVSLLRRVLRPQTLVSFGLAAAIVAFMLTRFDLNLRAVLSEMRHANPIYLGLAFASYYGAFGFRAARWRSLLESADIRPPDGQSLPGLPGLSAIFVLSWFANCIVPAKLGDAYRGFLLKQRARTSFSGTLGTIFAERLVDLATLAALLVGSGFVVFGSRLPRNITSWMLFAAGLAVVVVTGLLIIMRFRHLLRRLVPTRIRHHYVRVEEGVIGSFGSVPTVLGLTAIIWLLEGVRLYFVSMSVGAGISLAAALFVALLASLLTVVPVTPAGLGFVELGIVGALTLFGVFHQTAASVALLDRVVAYWSVIAVGAVLYLITRWRWR